MLTYGYSLLTMKKHFVDLFTFTSKEQKGLWVILLLAVFIVAGKYFMQRSSVITEVSVTQDSLMQAFLSGLSNAGESVDERDFEEMPLEVSQLNLNTADFQELMALGLPPGVARTLIKYRSGGATFYCREDLMRVYGMTDSIWRLIAKAVIFPERPKKIHGNVQTDSFKDIVPKNEKPALLVDINTADTLELMHIPGIGQVFASRILKYRDLLGGFVRREQLLEVYGMSQERYARCTTYVCVSDNRQVKKLNVNRDSFAVLLRHPYLSRKQVVALMAYRDYTDSTISFDGLKHDRVLDPVSLEKLSFYLEFD